MKNGKPARKVLISFLGTGNYTECEYFYDTEKTIKTKFIQYALVEFFCLDFSKEDKIFFFMTADAKKKYRDMDLEEKIKSLGLLADIIPVDIPSGKSDEEIWEIFNIMYKVLEENDSVILDITHGFRSLPMLGLVALYYAHYLKHISVKNIYYGAFEARDETGRTPIFQLTNFFDLLQWTSAVDAFDNYGSGDKLQDIVEETARFYHGTGSTVTSISTVTDSMLTLRGSKIVEGTIFTFCLNKIEELEKTDNLQAAFRHIISKIKSKLKIFKENDTGNFIHAVKWYIDHKMIPQAITMMQEGLLTCFMEKKGIDFHNKEKRMIVANYLNCISSRIKKEDENPRDNIKLKFETLGLDIGDDSYKELADFYYGIGDLRNGVNHGGFNNKAISHENIIKNVNKCFTILEKIYQEYLT